MDRRPHQPEAARPLGSPRAKQTVGFTHLSRCKPIRRVPVGVYPGEPTTAQQHRGPNQAVQPGAARHRHRSQVRPAVIRRSHPIRSQGDDRNVQQAEIERSHEALGLHVEIAVAIEVKAETKEVAQPGPPRTLFQIGKLRGQLGALHRLRLRIQTPACRASRTLRARPHFLSVRSPIFSEPHQDQSLEPD